VGQAEPFDTAGSGAKAADDVVVADWRTVAAAVARVQDHVDDALERAGVTPQWFAVLHELLRADDHRLAMNRLAREVSMTSGGFTKLADRMARDGLIDRRGSADDRRVVHAALTPEGVAMAQRAARIYRETLQTSVLDVIDRDGLSKIAQGVRALGMGSEDVPAGEFAVDDPRTAAGLHRRRDDAGS
jgi:DNA-binding MarR family transcriptional regulator